MNADYPAKRQHDPIVHTCPDCSSPWRLVSVERFLFPLRWTSSTILLAEIPRICFFNPHGCWSNLPICSCFKIQCFLVWTSFLIIKSTGLMLTSTPVPSKKSAENSASGDRKRCLERWSAADVCYFHVHFHGWKPQWAGLPLLDTNDIDLYNSI